MCHSAGFDEGARLVLRSGSFQSSLGVALRASPLAEGLTRGLPSPRVGTRTLEPSTLELGNPEKVDPAQGLVRILINGVPKASRESLRTRTPVGP